MPGHPSHTRLSPISLIAFFGTTLVGFSNGDSRFFNAKSHESMQTSILFKAPGRSSNRPIVILTGPAIGAEYSTPLSVRLSRALSSAWKWTRCNCTPRRIVRALFSTRVSTAVAFVVLAAMWWHNIAIDNTLEAQRSVAIDCLCGMPWGIVWAFRASRMPMPEEGGEE